jgi:hypothetical protein
MSEAELHTLRARLEGGIRNKAARGELRRGLPVGLVWGDEDGEVLLDPDEAIRGAIAVIFERFAELGSARQVWLWLRRERIRFPLQRFPSGEAQWVTPSYHQVHSVLTNPAYAYGKARRERYVDEHGMPRTRIRRLPRADWEVLIWEHHPGFIDRATFEANQARIARNTRPRAHEPGGAIREGAALLQGIAVCGRCGRKLKVHYQGRRGHHSPAYHCPGLVLVEGRGQWCLRVGGRQIDEAVGGALLQALTPTGAKAALRAAGSLEHDHDAALSQWRLQVERARHEAERRYRAVEPEHRLVARGLDVAREPHRATLTVRWRGGAIAKLAVALPPHQPAIRTDEDTIALLRRLAVHYDCLASIAGILNRQGRRSATGERFTAIIVGGLRRYRGIPAHQPPTEPPDGELLPIAKAAEELGIAPSTLHRWINDGFVAGEQDTPGAPWRMRVNDQLRALFVEDAPADYVPIVDAMRALGVSRQTVLQRVERGELEALHVRQGRRKGLRIRIPATDGLFDPTTMNAQAV